jgi:hypothetical protein
MPPRPHTFHGSQRPWFRILGAGLGALALLTLTALPGCRGKTEAGEVNLVLLLPETVDPIEGHPERVSTLTVDGEEFTDPKHPTTQRVTFKPKKDSPPDSVTVVYSYWPNMYTNIIRTKVVHVTTDSFIEASLNVEDPSTPDKILPIYFPTPYAVVDKMCEMALVAKGDVVYDIGCGDGRLVIRAVKKFGAKKGVGIDLNEDLLRECRENAKKEGVADTTEFRQDDALNIKNLSEASVVLLYLGDDLNLKMRPILQKTLKHGSRVVSHRFRMGDWEPDETKKIVATNNFGQDEEYFLHLWNIK